MRRDITLAGPRGGYRGLTPAFWLAGGRCPLLLDRLLIGPDGGQRGVVADVGDRVVRPGLAKVAGGLAPACGLDAELLAEQGNGDLCLVGAEARQLGEAAPQLRAVTCGGPERAGIAVVAVGDDPREFLCPCRHCPREPVQRRALGEHRGSSIGVEVGQLLRRWLVAV